MSYLIDLRCSTDGTVHSADRLLNNPCPDGGILEARYDLERLNRDGARETIAKGPASLWRYAPLLPVDRPEKAVTLGEGFTPLLPAPRLGDRLGCANLLIKDEGRNPSGTFKDRGASVALSRMVELGVDTVVHNSSGNAGGAWALYAARAGIRCVNLLPGDVMPASLQQSVMAGADTWIVEGPWIEAGPMAKRAAQRHGWFNVNTLNEPYRLEGKKTMGLEIAEQLDWELPDVVIYPTGGALGAIAIFKAFRELQALGWVDRGRRPRLIVAQYDGCAPIVRAFREGRERAEPWQDMDVLPGGLKSPSPPGDREALRILRESGGTAIAIGRAEALDAARRIVRDEGIFVCPEGAITLAALTRAIELGLVDRRERIVLMNTGSGLKSVPNFPLPTPPRIRAGDEIPSAQRSSF